MENKLLIIHTAACLCLVLLLTSRCAEKDPVICTGDQETNVVNHLASRLDNCQCEISIARGFFAGNTVYFYLNTSPNCQSAYDYRLFDCHGDEIPTTLLSSEENYHKFVSLDEILYRCNN